MIRFAIGERVRIVGVVPDYHAGRSGVVQAVEYHSPERWILDQYFVQMDRGEKVWFWPAQLRVDDSAAVHSAA
jgi:hypothetical protein